MWNTLKREGKENLKDFFKMNGTAAGAVGASELGGLDWIGMSEAIQSTATTGIVVIIFAYNFAKMLQLIIKMGWEREDRENERENAAKHITK